MRRFADQPVDEVGNKPVEFGGACGNQGCAVLTCADPRFFGDAGLSCSGGAFDDEAAAFPFAQEIEVISVFALPGGFRGNEDGA